MYQSKCNSLLPTSVHFIVACLHAAGVCERWTWRMTFTVSVYLGLWLHFYMKTKLAIKLKRGKTWLWTSVLKQQHDLLGGMGGIWTTASQILPMFVLLLRLQTLPCAAQRNAEWVYVNWPSVPMVVCLCRSVVMRQSGRKQFPHVK